MAKTATPVELKICDDCGKEGLKGNNGLRLHVNFHCPKNPDRLDLSSVKTKKDELPARKSKRGLQLSGQTDRPLAMLDQIPQHPGGAWAYYIHPEGATIHEALSAYPNGGGKGTKFGKNADFYQSRQGRKGFEYVGSQLSSEGIRRLIEVIEANQPDYLLFLKEEIEFCTRDINDVNGLTAAERDKQRTRKRQLEGQHRLAKQALDAPVLTKQLTEIANAQALAESFNPKQLLTLRSMISDSVSDNVRQMAVTLSETRAVEPDDKDMRSNTIDLTETVDAF